MCLVPYILTLTCGVMQALRMKGPLRGKKTVFMMFLSAVVFMVCFMILVNPDSGGSVVSYQGGYIPGASSPYVGHRNLMAGVGSEADREKEVLLMSAFLDLLKKFNSSSGPLINISITNVIQPASGHVSELNKLLLGMGVNVSDLTLKPTLRPPDVASNDDGLSHEELVAQFKPRMTNEQKIALFDALVKVDEVSRKNNFTYMIYSGTLIGSLRHHDVVPWDDDFDIFMNISQRDDIFRELDKLGPHYVTAISGSRLKFYMYKAIQTSKFPWKWPYIDISFFAENDTWLWDYSMEVDYGYNMYSFAKKDVFPLHKRPLGTFVFDSPRNPIANLLSVYHPRAFQSCATPHYSHKYENLTGKVYYIHCSDLKDIYPFVHRSPHENGVRETLMLGNRIIHSLIVDEPRSMIMDPYTFDMESILPATERIPAPTEPQAGPTAPVAGVDRWDRGADIRNSAEIP